MSLTDRMRAEREEQDRLSRIGYDRAKQSRYGFIQVSARKYAIIEVSSISADFRGRPTDPLGHKRFAFVDGSERLGWSEMQERYRDLLIEEIEQQRAEKNK